MKEPIAEENPLAPKVLFMRVVNGLFFYGGWLICMWAATRGWNELAVGSTALIVGIHCFFSPQIKKDLWLLCLICLAGTALDSFYQAIGLLSYACPNQTLCWLAPSWITSIYALLAINLDHSLGWLRHYTLLAALCGAGGAAATYLAGERTGVVQFHSGWTVPIITLIWLFFFPGLYLVSDRMDDRN